MASPDCKADSVSIVSEYTIVPEPKSSMDSLRLSSSDLPLLSIQYSQKGCLYSGHPTPLPSFLSLLQTSLSKTLSVFPPLAGRLSTDPATGHVSITCSDAGALLVHARAPSVSIDHLLRPSSDAPPVLQRFFPLDGALGLHGYSLPLAAIQLTELADGVFIAGSLNHAVVDGTSFWHFFNTLAEISRGADISRPPFFSRDNVFKTDAVLRLAGIPPPVNSSRRIRERLFHFSRESLLALKKSANVSVSSFQSLCAHLWRCVTRARNLPPAKTTTFTMTIDCRHRVDPKMDPSYFGNAFQIATAAASAGEVASGEIGWIASLLSRTVVAHDPRKGVEEWERDPRGFRLGGDPDTARIIVGGSPRFPMYDNDFGWGRPVAVRTGRAKRTDGLLLAYPGREGDGSVDLEVFLAHETMTRLENDPEFTKFVG